MKLIIAKKENQIHQSIDYDERIISMLESIDVHLEDFICFQSKTLTCVFSKTYLDCKMGHKCAFNDFQIVFDNMQSNKYF